VFTLIAFLLSIGNLLPRIAYLTRADLLIVSSMVLVFGALLESVITSRLHQGERQALALRLDLHARWIYPSLYVVIVVVVVMG